MEIALAAVQSRVVAGKLAGGLEGVNTHQVLAGESATPPCGQQGSKSLASLAALAAQSSSVARGNCKQYGVVDESSNGGGALVVVGV
jgi:hypothetical protein